MIEEWKRIVRYGYNKNYEISNHGSVRDLITKKAIKTFRNSSSAYFYLPGIYYNDK